MPGNKKNKRKPKVKRPPQEQMGYGAGANGPVAKGGQQGAGPGGGARSSLSPARVSRGAARGG